MHYRWLYIDFNSFFASVEQQLNPALRGKPIAVVPVQTDSTCAIAASYEAKAFGIRTGTPIYEAKKMCPQLICVLAQHEAYVDFHHRILEEIDRHIPVAKVCSIDEAACQLLENESSLEQATKIVVRIKEGLSKRVGECMTCSVGVAPNCYLAKVAADMQKPDGLTFLSKEDLPHKLFSLALRDLPGIGANMEEKLHRCGIRTIQSLCALDAHQMHKVWGSILGERMWLQLAGMEVLDLPTQRTTVGHSHVLAPELRDANKARPVAIRLTLKAVSRLRRLGYTASLITLRLKTIKDVAYEAGVKVYPAKDSLTFLHALHGLWQKLMQPIGSTHIRKIAITLSQLVEDDTMQPDLFAIEPKDKAKAEKISKVMDLINQKYGSDSILFGILPKEGKSFSGTKIAFTRVPEMEEFFE